LPADYYNTTVLPRSHNEENPPKQSVGLQFTILLIDISAGKLLLLLYF